MEFNKEQLEAINAENKNILISAGAGAGKSGTLTERVIQLIRNGKADILQMLVITFTRDAAASIRDKIRKALITTMNTEYTNRKIAESVTNLPASHISTIHSFCSEVIHQGASLLDIDSTFSIMEDSIRRNTFEIAVKDAIEEIGKKTYPRAKKNAFGAFRRSVDARIIKDICHNVYDVLMGIPHPFDRLNKLIDRLSMDPNPWQEEIVQYGKKMLLAKKYLLDELTELHQSVYLKDNYKSICEQDIALLKTFLNEVRASCTADDLIDAANKLSSGCVATKRSGTMTEAEANTYACFLAAHGILKNKPKGKSDKKPVQYVVNILNEMKACKKADILTTQRQIRGLAVLLEEVHNQFTAIKKNNATLDYSDLEQYAFEILTEYPDMRKFIQDKYKYVFVDECQDVSAIQHAIINALKSDDNNIFYVGDIKQSIYRFRHADPLQFLEMRNTYSEDKGAEHRKIYFQKNYRSSSAIIDGVNLVFSNLLDKDYTEIDYEQGDHLLVGRNDIPDSPNEVILVNSKIKRDPVTGNPVTDGLQAQCAEVGNRIRELVKDGYSFKDIVILLRKKENGQDIANFMSAMRIPCYFNGKMSFYDTPEVSLLVDILKTINNDYQDYPLLATLRSEIFRFTDQDFAEIRLAYDRKQYSFSEAFHEAAGKNTTDLEKRCHQALETITTLKKESAEIYRVSDIVWNIIKKTNYFATQSAFPDGEIRQKNLDAFYNKTLAYEALGNYKLADFLQHVDELRKSKGTGSDDPVPMTDNDDFVRIMTIHGSKGLEFPVVFIMDAQKSIHHKDNSVVQIHIETENAGHRSLGLYMPCGNKNDKFHTVHDTYGKQAFKAMNLLHELAEESRVLYVAMTRAMNKLIIVGTVDADKTENWYVNNKAYRLMNTDNMLDMIMPTVLKGIRIDHEGDIISNTLWKVSFVEAKGIEAETVARNNVKYPNVKNDIDFDGIWGSVIKGRTNLPSKTAVSYIQENDLKTNDEKIGYIALGEDPEVPEFMSINENQPEGAALGTLLHKIMRVLPMKTIYGISDRNKAKEFIKEFICNTESIPEAQAEELARLMTNGILNFVFSPVGGAVCEAKNVSREQEFVCWVDVMGYPILLQGVLDLMYEDDNGEYVILDYKTDYDTNPDTIIQKHGDQLNYYRMAVEKIKKASVSKMYVITMRNGNAIEIPQKNVQYI